MSDDNIIEFKKREKDNSPKPDYPPLINLPPITKYILLGLIAIHIIVHVIVPMDIQAVLILTFGFVPSVWTGADFMRIPALSYLSPVTYMALHGNWLHLLMNGAMLMAFGTGVERVMGSKRYILFFLACGLLALIPELVVHGASQYPIIGASGAESGLFAAILIIMQREGRLPNGRYGIWTIAIIWIVISVLFGLFGGAMAGGPIAWLAHIGGFIGGVLLLQTRLFKI